MGDIYGPQVTKSEHTYNKSWHVISILDADVLNTIGFWNKHKQNRV